MKPLRLGIAFGLITVVMGVTPAASANDCTNPKQPCGGCRPNLEMTLEDPRPIVCYV